MNTIQAINLSLFEAFEQRGIEFAYPTQTIYLAGNANTKLNLPVN
jgi:small-conductance mechanosensitive channel